MPLKKELEYRKKANEAIIKLTSIYNAANIEINHMGFKTRYLDTPLEADFYFEETKKAVLDNAQPDKITLIFVQDLQSKNDGAETFDTKKVLGGKAGGTPGPQGFINQFSAVLIHMPTDLKNRIYKKDELGYVAAHEVGHYLGLTHESANSDTGTADLANLMYYAAGNHSRGTLNEKQKFIIQHMPIVQIE